MAVPIVGYLILFNDSIASHLSFQHLAAENTSAFGLSGGARLKLIYVGLIFLGLANLLYRWQRPYVLKLADNEFDFVNVGLSNFSVSTYIDFHGRIRHSDFDPYTRHGKYYDSEWEEFLTSALGPKVDDERIGRDSTKAHWVEAKQKHESLLRSILTETFFRDSTRLRRGWLILCILVAVIGYCLLAVPSADLFIKVMTIIIAPLLGGGM